jgi:hypothetical protein
MSAPDAPWHEANNDFLAAGMNWLRSRLRGEEAGEWVVPLDSALGILVQRFQLSHLEQSLLLLCAGMELDPALGELCAQSQGDPRRPFPTFALALRISAEPAWESISPQGPLRYWHLIEIHRVPGEPLVHACLSADEQIVHFLKGIRVPDERLLPLLLPPPEAGEHLSAAQEMAVGEITRLARQRALFHLAGDEDECLRTASAAADRLGLPLIHVQSDLIPGDVGDLETLIRIFQRELMLAPSALCLRGQSSEPRSSGALRRFLAGMHLPVFLVGVSRTGLGPDVQCLEISSPSAQEQAELWQSLLGEPAKRLASTFNFGLEAIERIASNLAEGEGVWEACLAHSAPRFGRLAQRVVPVSRWDHLVLPPHETALLRQIVTEASQRRQVLDDWGFRAKTNRGLGLHALFTGESGTGKTLAAEVIAHELDLHLVRIDLSAVVDKYIGETEKNLGRIFDAAGEGGSVLFFDEADALFGKRTEVKDSHDRYANIEIDYLLQRMEAFQGIAILATNSKGALDTAFLRRLRFVVPFPFPGAVERKAIWQRVFPTAVPREELDFEFLAQINLTGGSIYSIALGSAFRAAARGGSVTMPIILETARAELRKLERPVPEAALAWPR